jgi:molybdopterin/thiamine biosynthesis adenylyltransferase
MSNQPPNSLPALTDEERAIYQWQIWVRGFGETGQQRLKGASVLVSRCGGLGGVVAYELAAAGVGRLVLAHAGNVRPSDLNRQLLMTHAGIGQSRIESVRQRLLELNPRLEIVAVEENITEQNAEPLVAQADLIVDCAPLFTERFELNRQAVRQSKPLVECAVYEMEGQITSILPGNTPCLSCLYPEDPPVWKLQFPIFGAVAGVLGCLAATEAIKLLSGLGEPLVGQLLTCDLADMTFRRRRIERSPQCAVCGEAKLQA